ncbi:hypothetical protein [Niabella hibiscisoli]|uniref:hypothetical protein n=1 Tax=Niabella hibiscisoli TaxID=1825928 RepID=UPI001F0F1610|nr:hypothetical protein [Niabella hibiscisoli]MCH5721249.1 hypothetical protein [Niabella hibiscisoli]
MITTGTDCHRTFWPKVLNKRRLGFTIGCWILLCSNAYAQINESFKLDQTVPFAPEGAKFANYYLTPSVSATGTIPIEIPLYEIICDDIKIPISLSYQTSGIKVTELSGSVGLGWSLNVGGGIYRSINGLPDEYAAHNISTFLSPLYNMSDYMANFSNQATVQNQSVLKDFADNHSDINQDNYSYNFLNFSGGVFFNNQLELKELNDNKLFFSYDSKYLNYFLAKDGYGNTFKFDVKENTRNSSYSTQVTSSFNGSVYGATAWKLSEVSTMYDKKINFSYVDYTTDYLYPSSNSLYRIAGINVGNAGNCFDEKTIFSTTYANINNTNKLISSVTSQDMTVMFFYSDELNASNWKRKLDRIEVKNKNGEIVKKSGSNIPYLTVIKDLNY